MNRMDNVSHIGLDGHKKFSRVTARDKNNLILWRQRLEHNDRCTLRHRMREWPAGTPVILESSFGWSWLSEELLAADLEPHLADVRKVAGWRKARGLAKSNRKDADLLSELWCEKPHWWKVWLPPQEVQALRERMRYRMSLVKIQSQEKNRIHSLLSQHGILHEHSDLFGVAGRQFLNQLLADNDVTLRESTRDALRGHLKLLDEVRRLAAQATRRVRQDIRRSEEGELLRTIPGIGDVLAYTLLAEIGDIQRFDNANRLVSYALLAPRSHDSGDEDKDDQDPKGRHIGFVGRRTLKWAFIEAAHGAVRRGGRFRQIFDRRTDKGKKERNRGYITVGNELARVVYVLLTKKVRYTDDPPHRRGAKKNRARSGTG